MDFVLDAVETRVLGSLLEKEVTTPEYYPLSLNALVNACNQKSNRDPAVNYDDETVENGLESLRHKSLVTTITGAGSRVPKYSHRFSEVLNLGRRELAILCELMLRGPQTLGELRNRTERMHKFDDTDQVQAVIDKMPELVVKLPRRPGEKEVRFAQLMSGPPDVQAAEAQQPLTPRQDRISAIEAEVAQMRQEVDGLKQQFADFRRQFE
jgi:uncharacterized protein YceH (UPF0502 family)